MNLSVLPFALSSLAGLAICVCSSDLFAAKANSISVKLPDETAAFKPGPNRELVHKHCATCHSVDYVETQPRGPNFKEAFWRAEANKMVKVYGASIDETDIGKIVEYLTQTY